MNVTARPWLSAVLLTVLVFLPSPAHAGMSPEEIKAFEGYKAGALKGDPLAQGNLGGCYYLGTGVAKDFVQAVSWYRKAADQGSAMGQASLGGCYSLGRGVVKDEIEGYAYFNLAGITYAEARRIRDVLKKKLSPEAVSRGEQRTKELQKEIQEKIEAKKTGK